MRILPAICLAVCVSGALQSAAAQAADWSLTLSAGWRMELVANGLLLRPPA